MTINTSWAAHTACAALTWMLISLPDTRGAAPCESNWSYNASQSSSQWAHSSPLNFSDGSTIKTSSVDVWTLSTNVGASGISFAADITNKTTAFINQPLSGNTYSVSASSWSFGEVSGVWYWQGPVGHSCTRTVKFDVDMWGRVSTDGSARKDNLSSANSTSSGSAHCDFGSAVIRDVNSVTYGPYFWADATGYANPAGVSSGALIDADGTFTWTDGSPIEAIATSRYIDDDSTPQDYWNYAYTASWYFEAAYAYNHVTSSGANKLELTAEFYLDTSNAVAGNAYAGSQSESMVEGYVSLTFL